MHESRPPGSTSSYFFDFVKQDCRFFGFFPVAFSLTLFVFLATLRCSGDTFIAGEVRRLTTERGAMGTVQYEYHPETTIGMLLRQYFGVEMPDSSMEERERTFAELLGVTTETVRDWSRGPGTLTNGLLTRYAAKFEELTGIDIDRLLVLEAKRAIVSQHPDTNTEVLYASLHTRQEIVDAITQHTKRCGAPLVERQLGIVEGSLFMWRNGHHLPGFGPLVACIPELQNDTLIPGNGNDVRTVLIRREVDTGATPGHLSDITTFEALRSSFLAFGNGMEHSRFARESGVERGVIAALRKRHPSNPANVSEETIRKMLRFLLKKRASDASDAKTKGGRVSKKTKPERTPAEVSSRAATLGAEAKHQQIANLLSELARLCCVGEVDDFAVHLTGQRALPGKGVDDVRFALTADSFVRWGGGQTLTSAEVQDTKRLAEELLRRLGLFAQIAAAERTSLLQTLEPTLIEIGVSARAVGMPYPAAGNEQMAMMRARARSGGKG
jgi:hypothetical protein